ncbi:ribose import ATP-binding protein RbsA [Synergistales bacterium]|nr:ribose import ATP-binding protein RbsA [Synergistales bacterium]
MSDSGILLQISHISKRFPAVIAVDDVSLSIKKGETHLIIGENGAGKSTLVKIIAGLYVADSGSMVLNGENYAPQNVRAAQALGINIIHQELNMMVNRTVAQNVYIGHEPMKNTALGIIDTAKMDADCKKLLENLGIDILPTELVKNLSIAQQQMVEVAKALATESKLIIMDEPTSSLTEQEIENLFRITRNLQAEGVSVVYISHRMKELWEIGDRVTVMRDGKYIATHNINEIKMNELIPLMVGRKIENIYHRNWNEPKEALLRTENLSGLRFRNINIQVRAGEVVGFAGLVGAGRTEVGKAIFGYDPIEGGSLFVAGSKVELRGYRPKRAIALGLALLPEDRKNEGLFIRRPIYENVTSATIRKISSGGLLNPKKEIDIADDFVKRLKIATPSSRKLVMELSGGNQQKVVIAKWLCTKAKVFILDEPTRGIDIGAKSEIYELIDALVAEGAGVLMISSELQELEGIADRIYVLADGEIAGHLDRRTSDITQEKLVALAIGGVHTA